jgi:hypothetical protein
VSDLLPATDGLYLGETTIPRRWDGSRLINLSGSQMPDVLLLNGSREMTGDLKPDYTYRKLGYWDGSDLRKITRITVHGMAVVDAANSEADLWVTEWYTGYGGYAKVSVPSGKRFKLWAMGLGYCDSPDYVRIICKNATAGSTLKATTNGAPFEDYEASPPWADGPVEICLRAGNAWDNPNQICGYMVFSIE